MINIIISALVFFSTVYDLNITTVQGNEVSLSQFQGKKILVVNIATNSGFANQLLELEQLYQQHKDSLVVVAFPSDDFGNEPRTNAWLQQRVASLQLNFYVAQKTKVSGEGLHPLYELLKQAPGTGGYFEVKGDFQKIFIDKAGKPYAQFSGRVSPVDPVIQAAIATQGF